MKRFCLHVSVKDLDESVRFYSTLFATQPAVRETDYAKWMLNRPIVVTPWGTKLCRPSETVLDILPLPQIGSRW